MRKLGRCRLGKEAQIQEPSVCARDRLQVWGASATYWRRCCAALRRVRALGFERLNSHNLSARRLEGGPAGALPYTDTMPLFLRCVRTRVHYRNAPAARETMNLISLSSDRHLDGSGILRIMRIPPPPPRPSALVLTSPIVWPALVGKIPEGLASLTLPDAAPGPQGSSCAFHPPPPFCGLKACVPPHPYAEPYPTDDGGGAQVMRVGLP